MFTGIVEETGIIKRFQEGEQSWELLVQGAVVLGDLKPGDSVAVNGCCLTATDIDVEANTIRFDLLGETVRLTGFHTLSEGSLVNLERSLTPTARMGGHFVSGHIDCTGSVEVFEERGKDVYMRVEVKPEFQQYLVYKGSIAIDGISLTVAEVDEIGLAVWLIPHTLEVTNLKACKAGSIVNLEFDLLAKYVEKLVAKNTDLDVPAHG